jgi:hypothetical protein
MGVKGRERGGKRNGEGGEEMGWVEVVFVF